MADIKLKRCPFCGKEGVIHKQLGNYKQPIYRAWCMTENCICYMTYNAFDSAEEAAEAWNRRENNG